MSPSTLAEKLGRTFVISIEVVPPASPDPTSTLTALGALYGLPADAINVADSPLARPRLSALVMAHLIQTRLGFEPIVHLTARDQNQVGLQAHLWGAMALGIRNVLVITGDRVTLGHQPTAKSVHDLAATELVQLAKASGQVVGVVLDPRPEVLDRELRKLEAKIAAEADFVITQPLYDEHSLAAFLRQVKGVSIPILVGVLPLRSSRHAEFLHHRVPGMNVPAAVRERMQQARARGQEEGIAIAREMLAAAQQSLAGACIMPPFGHYEMAAAVLGTGKNNQ